MRTMRRVLSCLILTITTLIVFNLVSAAPDAPAAILMGNFVWHDRDGDGVQDASESGVPNVNIQLWNGAKTQLITTTVTNANGNYTLQAPGAGQYRMRVILPATATGFSPKDQTGDTTDSDVNPSGTNLGFTDIYDLDSNVVSIVSIDAGLLIPTPILMGNFVWDDQDEDGVQDAGEPGVPNVNIQLWNGAKNQLITTTVTNANGNYTLQAPDDGQYRMRVILPATATGFSPKDQTGDTLDSDVNPSGADLGFTDIYNLPPNLLSITTIDAGILFPTPIFMGNFVWDDVDEDGVQDAGEKGVPNVPVQLWNASKTQLITATVTNANGNYTLLAPGPGQYRVRVIKASTTISFTLKNQTADTTDSDVNPSGADLGFTDVYDLAPNLLSITTIDAGFVGFSKIFLPIVLK